VPQLWAGKAASTGVVAMSCLAPQLPNASPLSARGEALPPLPPLLGSAGPLGGLQGEASPNEGCGGGGRLWR